MKKFKTLLFVCAVMLATTAAATPVIHPEVTYQHDVVAVYDNPSSINLESSFEVLSFKAPTGSNLIFYDVVVLFHYDVVEVISHTYISSATELPIRYSQRCYEKYRYRCYFEENALSKQYKYA